MAQVRGGAHFISLLNVSRTIFIWKAFCRMRVGGGAVSFRIKRCCKVWQCTACSNQSPDDLTAGELGASSIRGVRLANLFSLRVRGVLVLHPRESVGEYLPDCAGQDLGLLKALRA